MGKRSNLKTPKQSKTQLQVHNVKHGLKTGNLKVKKVHGPETPPHLPKLHFIGGFFGVVRSGKTYSAVSLVKDYDKHGCFNMRFLISCTYESNTVLHEIDWEPGGIFTDAATSEAALAVIIGMIEKRVQDHYKELEYKRVYEKWRKEKRYLTLDEQILLNDEEHRPPIDIPYPKALLFIDDMINTPLMANTINNKLSHLCLHHRHVAGGAGVTIIQCLQKFKSGMPRAVRSNLSLVALFATCDMTELEDMWQEVANSVTFETFKKLFFKAVEQPHSFLLIDKMADPETMFGINFDQRFYIDPLEERRKLLFGSADVDNNRS
jgi:hypothetical protein